MEEFYQFLLPATTSSTDSSFSFKRKQDRVFVYSSPYENGMDRCGEIQNGQYFACSELLVGGKKKNEIWMKIRRGYFSNTKRNGYIRVYVDFTHKNTTSKKPVSFRHLIQLPKFPSYFCSRQTFQVKRLPIFEEEEEEGVKNTSSQYTHRILPAWSVFQITEVKFNKEFTRLTYKMSSSSGIQGWFCGSFGRMLVHVKSDDFNNEHHSIHSSSGMMILYQNVATRTGKLQGELPIRAIPTLQAPRIRTLPSFSLFAIEQRKLIKDQVWIKLTKHQNELTQQEKPQEEEEEEEEEAWVIERNAHNGQQVAVPWGTLRPAQVRYYRNIYTKHVLPLRKEPDVSSECVGELEMGAVFASEKQVLPQDGRMWIQVPLYQQQEDTIQYGWVIQCTAKKNTVVLEEIPCPGNFSSPMYHQVVLQEEQEEQEEQEDRLAAYAEPSSTSREWFYVKNNSFLQVKGTIYNKETKRMWAMVMTSTLDRENLEFSVRKTSEEVENILQEELHVVYLPMVHPSLSPVQTVLKPLYRSMRPLNEDGHQDAFTDSNDSRATRGVVFTGRASKLFGNLTAGSNDKSWNSQQRVASAAGDDDHDDEEEEEENIMWMRRRQHRSSTCASKVQQNLAYTLSLLQTPFSCLMGTSGRQAYAHLGQEEDETEGLL